MKAAKPLVVSEPRRAARLGASMLAPAAAVLAKPHRMAVMTAGCLIGAVELLLWETQYALLAAAWIIGVGAAVTCITRTRAIGKQLHARAR